MNDQWPPPAPALDKDFEKAVQGKENEAAVAPQPAITPSEAAALEAQNKRTAPHHVFNPPGMRPAALVNRAEVERIAKMQQRIESNRSNQGRMRDDFGRAAGREM